MFLTKKSITYFLLFVSFLLFIFYIFYNFSNTPIENKVSSENTSAIAPDGVTAIDAKQNPVVGGEEVSYIDDTKNDNNTGLSIQQIYLDILDSKQNFCGYVAIEADTDNNKVDTVGNNIIEQELDNSESEIKTIDIPDVPNIVEEDKAYRVVIDE